MTEYISKAKELDVPEPARLRARGRREYHRLHAKWRRTTVTRELTRAREIVHDVLQYVRGTRGQEFPLMLGAVDDLLVSLAHLEARDGTGATRTSVRKWKEKVGPGRDAAGTGDVGRGTGEGVDGNPSRKESFK